MVGHLGPAHLDVGPGSAAAPIVYIERLRRGAGWLPGLLACLLESPTLWEESGESMYSSCCCCWGQLPGAGFISDLDPQPHLPCVYLALPFFGAPPTRPWTHIYLLMEGMEGLHQGSSRSPSGLK